MPHKTFFGNDPSFGKRKTFNGEYSPGTRVSPLSPTANQSEYTADPSYMKGLANDPHQGTSSLIPKADFYSNPNPHEHVRGFPSKNKEVMEQNKEKMIIYGLIGLLFVVFFLRVREN